MTLMTMREIAHQTGLDHQQVSQFKRDQGIRPVDFEPFWPRFDVRDFAELISPHV